MVNGNTNAFQDNKADGGYAKDEFIDVLRVL